MGDEVTNSSVLLDNSTDVTTPEYETPTTVEGQIVESGFNSSSVELVTPSSAVDINVYIAFNILELTMTSLELMVWIMAAVKMPRWRKNYRNQMLMQISVSRFVKRVILSCMFLQEDHQLSNWPLFDVILNSSQIYIDFVIVILVFFLVKHMYESLIIVLVKVRQNSLYKVSVCSWLLPLPVSVLWTGILLFNSLDKWVVYLLICCMFRWPLIFMGTAVYLTILYRVMSDKIRRFARSLTVVTFLMCLIINFYLVSKDVIYLWCLESFGIKLISYISGFVMNFLILSFYVILITLDYNHCNQTPKAFNSIPNYSLADTCCKVSHIDEND